MSLSAAKPSITQKEQIVNMRFTPLQRGGGNGLPFGNFGGSDTSDDDDDNENESSGNNSTPSVELAHSTSNHMLREVGSSAVGQRGFQRPNVTKSKSKTVKKAIADHVQEHNNGEKSRQGNTTGSTASTTTGCCGAAEVRKVTRVVKTRKHDSVMGEGLMASEEGKGEGRGDVEDAVLGSCDIEHIERANSPMNNDIVNLRQYIRDKSQRCDQDQSRDVLLRESSPEPRHHHQTNLGESSSLEGASYKPPLMGIDTSFVPPELVVFGVSEAVWECFADALNAAIPRGTQEMENQINRWNSDAFEDLGFNVCIHSLDAGMTLSVFSK